MFCLPLYKSGSRLGQAVMSARLHTRIAVGLLFVFCYGNLVPSAYAITTVGDDANVQKIRSGLAAIGTGENTRVSVRLRNGLRLKGYIAASGAQNLTIAHYSTGLRRTVRYSEIAGLKAQNLTSGQKYAIGTAIIVALLLALAYGLRGS